MLTKKVGDIVALTQEFTRIYRSFLLILNCKWCDYVTQLLLCDVKAGSVSEFSGYSFLNWDWCDCNTNTVTWHKGGGLPEVSDLILLFILLIFRQHAIYYWNLFVCLKLNWWCSSEQSTWQLILWNKLCTSGEITL